MLSILITAKSGESRTMEFDANSITIGTGAENDVILDDEQVSRRHTRVVLKAGAIIIVDLKSSRGTYLVNAADFSTPRRLDSPYILKPGQKIAIGRTTLAFEETGDVGARSASGHGSPAPASPPRQLPTLLGGLAQLDTFHDGSDPVRKRLRIRTASSEADMRARLSSPEQIERYAEDQLGLLSDLWRVTKQPAGDHGIRWHLDCSAHQPGEIGHDLYLSLPAALFILTHSNRRQGTWENFHQPAAGTCASFLELSALTRYEIELLEFVQHVICHYPPNFEWPT